MSYSIWMLEYSHCLEHPVGCIFYGVWDGSTRMFAYSYAYIEGNGHKILVDIGHDNRGSNKPFNDVNNIVDFQPPDVVLGKVGVRPEDIDTIILTHVHYDHAGAARYFPNATFYLQRVELESSRWALDNAHLYASIIGALDPDDVTMLEKLAADGTLTLLDSPVQNLFPGLHIRTALDTHTMGGQYVVVETGGENWVITGDALYSYENAEGIDQSGIPVNIGFGGGSGWRGLQIIDEMAKTAGDTGRLVIVHEYDTFRRHPSRKYDDNLHVAELVLGNGQTSRIADPAGASPGAESTRPLSKEQRHA